MFSLSLPHFLSLSLSSRFLALPLSRSRSFFPSFSLSLSLSLSLSRFLSFFLFFTHTRSFARILSRCLSLLARAYLRHAFTHARRRGTCPRMRAQARSTHLNGRSFARNVFFSTASSLKLDFFFWFLSTFRLPSLLTHGSCLFIILADRLRSLTLYSIILCIFFKSSFI